MVRNMTANAVPGEKRPARSSSPWADVGKRTLGHFLRAMHRLKTVVCLTWASLAKRSVGKKNGGFYERIISSIALDVSLH